MRLISLNAGGPQRVEWGATPFITSINKRPIDGPVRIGFFGVEGDSQSDTRCHGGEEHAICVYPREHYAAIAAFLGSDLPIPSFGENMTTEGLLETEVCLGDIYRVGGVLFQVSKPREPCSTLARKHARTDLVKEVLRTGFCGWYARVLEEGRAAAGEAIQRVERPEPGLTVARAMEAMFSPSPDERLLLRFSSCTTLTEGWRHRLERRVARFKGAD